VVKEIEEVSLLLCMMFRPIVLAASSVSNSIIFCNRSICTLKAESDLRRAQEEFDKQVELVTEICNKIIKSSEQHAKYLSKFVEAEAEYYQQSDKYLDDLLNNRTNTSENSQKNNSTGFATFASLPDTASTDAP